MASVVSPGVSREWGGDWVSSQRKAARPFVDGAIDLACEGLGELDIPIKREKLIRVLRAANNWDTAGSFMDPGLIQLYLAVSDVKHRKLKGKMGLLATVAFHEMIHDERDVHVPGRTDLIEMAATEGLAHYGDSLFGSRLLETGEFYDIRTLIAGLKPDRLDLLTRALCADVAHDIEEARQTGATDIFDKWFETEVPSLDTYPAGVAVGACHVARHIEAGVELAELMAWPPEDILGVQAVMAEVS